MNWLKRFFGKPALQRPEASLPERPADWNLTLDDLFAEMKAGKRKSVGQPELEWAKQYERSLIPEGMRFPEKGDLYESNQDQTVSYMTLWAAPFSGGGEGMLYKGERIWIDHAPESEKPLGAYAIPVEYKKLEARMVPPGERDSPKYGGFCFYFDTIELNRNFTLIRTGFKGKRNQR